MVDFVLFIHTWMRLVLLVIIHTAMELFTTICLSLFKNIQWKGHKHTMIPLKSPKNIGSVSWQNHMKMRYSSFENVGRKNCWGLGVLVGSSEKKDQSGLWKPGALFMPRLSCLVFVSDWFSLMWYFSLVLKYFIWSWCCMVHFSQFGDTVLFPSLQMCAVIIRTHYGLQPL